MGECHITAAKEISVGSGCAISWNTQIMDTDFHKIYVDEKQSNPDKKVSIGDHVWIASHVNILKGTVIPSGCVAASGSQINGSFSNENAVITGLPNRELRTGIRWEM